MPHSYQDVLDFFMEHPRWKDAREDLVKHLSYAADSGVLCYCVDENDKINGSLIGYKENPETVFIAFGRAKTNEAFKRLVQWMWTMFPQAIVKARRRGKIVTYKTPELYRKLLAYA